VAGVPDTLSPVQKEGGQEVTDDHYPVRRRGQARRLDPNWTGIAWLEAHSYDDTEIVMSFVPQGGASSKLGEGLQVDRSRFTEETLPNLPGPRAMPVYIRPMFQVMPLYMSSAQLVRYGKPCATCYDVQYAGRDCPSHPAHRWSPEHLRWYLPGNDPAPEQVSPYRAPTREQAAIDTGERRNIIGRLLDANSSPPDGAPELLVAIDGAGEPILLQPGIQITARDYMAPELEHYRAQMELYANLITERAAQEITRAVVGESEPQFTGIADVEPDPVQGTPMQDLIDAYRHLADGPDGDTFRRQLSEGRWRLDETELDRHYRYTPPREGRSETVSPTEVRVDGQTVEGIQSFTIHIEPEREGDHGA
jgi:hypothetical protein